MNNQHELVSIKLAFDDMQQLGLSLNDSKLIPLTWDVKGYPNASYEDGRDYGISHKQKDYEISFLGTKILVSLNADFRLISVANENICLSIETVRNLFLHNPFNIHRLELKAQDLQIGEVRQRSTVTVNVRDALIIDVVNDTRIAASVQFEKRFANQRNDFQLHIQSGQLELAENSIVTPIEKRVGETPALNVSIHLRGTFGPFKLSESKLNGLLCANDVTVTGTALKQQGWLLAKGKLSLCSDVTNKHFISAHTVSAGQKIFNNDGIVICYFLSLSSSENLTELRNNSVFIAEVVQGDAPRLTVINRGYWFVQQAFIVTLNQYDDLPLDTALAAGVRNEQVNQDHPFWVVGQTGLQQLSQTCKRLMQQVVDNASRRGDATANDGITNYFSGFFNAQSHTVIALESIRNIEFSTPLLYGDAVDLTTVSDSPLRIRGNLEVIKKLYLYHKEISLEGIIRAPKARLFCETITNQESFYCHDLIIRGKNKGTPARKAIFNKNIKPYESAEEAGQIRLYLDEGVTSLITAEMRGIRYNTISESHNIVFVAFASFPLSQAFAAPNNLTFRYHSHPNAEKYIFNHVNVADMVMQQSVFARGVLRLELGNFGVHVQGVTADTFVRVRADKELVVNGNHAVLTGGCISAQSMDLQLVNHLTIGQAVNARKLNQNDFSEMLRNANDIAAEQHKEKLAALNSLRSDGSYCYADNSIGINAKSVHVNFGLLRASSLRGKVHSIRNTAGIIMLDELTEAFQTPQWLLDVPTSQQFTDGSVKWTSAYILSTARPQLLIESRANFRNTTITNDSGVLYSAGDVKVENSQAAVVYQGNTKESTDRRDWIEVTVTKKKWYKARRLHTKRKYHENPLHETQAAQLNDKPKKPFIGSIVAHGSIKFDAAKSIIANHGRIQGENIEGNVHQLRNVADGMAGVLRGDVSSVELENYFQENLLAMFTEGNHVDGPVISSRETATMADELLSEARRVIYLNNDESITTTRQLYSDTLQELLLKQALADLSVRLSGDEVQDANSPSSSVLARLLSRTEFFAKALPKNRDAEQLTVNKEDVIAALNDLLLYHKTLWRGQCVLKPILHLSPDLKNQIKNMPVAYITANKKVEFINRNSGSTIENIGVIQGENVILDAEAVSVIQRTIACNKTAYLNRRNGFVTVPLSVVDKLSGGITAKNTLIISGRKYLQVGGNLLSGIGTYIEVEDAVIAEAQRTTDIVQGEKTSQEGCNYAIKPCFASVCMHSNGEQRIVVTNGGVQLAGVKITANGNNIIEAKDDINFTTKSETFNTASYKKSGLMKSKQSSGTDQSFLGNVFASGQIASTKSTAQSEVFDGLNFVSVPPDNHCFFHAIRMHLNLDMRVLRRAVAANMLANIDTLLPYWEGTEQSFRNHIEAIGERDEWGSHYELQIIQEIYRRPIIVIRSNANPTISDNVDEYQGDPIFIYYNGEDHYEGFAHDESADAKEILLRIRNQINQGRRAYYTHETQFIESSGKDVIIKSHEGDICLQFTHLSSRRDAILQGQNIRIIAAKRRVTHKSTSRGFSGLSYSENKLSEIGSSVLQSTLDINRNLKLQAQDDIELRAAAGVIGGDLTGKAQSITIAGEKQEYSRTMKSKSIGISFFGSGALESLLQSDTAETVLEKLLSDIPFVNSLKAVCDAEDGADLSIAATRAFIQGFNNASLLANALSGDSPLKDICGSLTDSAGITKQNAGKREFDPSVTVSFTSSRFSERESTDIGSSLEVMGTFQLEADEIILAGGSKINVRDMVLIAKRLNVIAGKREYFSNHRQKGVSVTANVGSGEIAAMEASRGHGYSHETNPLNTIISVKNRFLALIDDEVNISGGVIDADVIDIETKLLTLISEQAKSTSKSKHSSAGFSVVGDMILPKGSHSTSENEMQKTNSPAALRARSLLSLAAKRIKQVGSIIDAGEMADICYLYGKPLFAQAELISETESAEDEIIEQSHNVSLFLVEGEVVQSGMELLASSVKRTAENLANMLVVDNQLVLNEKFNNVLAGFLTDDRLLECLRQFPEAVALHNLLSQDKDLLHHNSENAFQELCTNLRIRSAINAHISASPDVIIHNPVLLDILIDALNAENSNLMVWERDLQTNTLKHVHGSCDPNSNNTKHFLMKRSGRLHRLLKTSTSDVSIDWTAEDLKDFSRYKSLAVSFGITNLESGDVTGAVNHKKGSQRGVTRASFFAKASRGELAPSSLNRDPNKVTETLTSKKSSFGLHVDTKAIREIAKAIDSLFEPPKQVPQPLNDGSDATDDENDEDITRDVSEDDVANIDLRDVPNLESSQDPVESDLEDEIEQNTISGEEIFADEQKQEARTELNAQGRLIEGDQFNANMHEHAELSADDESCGASTKLSGELTKDINSMPTRHLRKVDTKKSGTRWQDKNNKSKFVSGGLAKGLRDGKTIDAKRPAEGTVTLTRKIADFSAGVDNLSVKGELHGGMGEQGVALATSAEAKVGVDNDNAVQLFGDGQVQFGRSSIHADATVGLKKITVAGHKVTQDMLTVGKSDHGPSASVTLPNARASGKLSATEGVEALAIASLAEGNIAYASDKRCIDGDGIALRLEASAGLGGAIGFSATKKDAKSTPAEIYSARGKLGCLAYLGGGIDVIRTSNDPGCVNKSLLDKADSSSTGSPSMK